MEVAITFVEWANANGWRCPVFGSDKWIKYKDNTFEYYKTTKELFELFRKESPIVLQEAQASVARNDPSSTKAD